MPEPDVMIQATRAGIAALSAGVGTVLGALGMYYFRLGNKGGSTPAPAIDPSLLVKAPQCEKVQERFDGRLASLKRENDQDHGVFFRAIGDLKEYRASATTGMSALVEKVGELKTEQSLGFDKLSKQIGDLYHPHNTIQTGHPPD